jgi:hypothetical protein
MTLHDLANPPDHLLGSSHIVGERLTPFFLGPHKVDRVPSNTCLPRRVPVSYFLRNCKFRLSLNISIEKKYMKLTFI